MTTITKEIQIDASNWYHDHLARLVSFSRYGRPVPDYPSFRRYR
jgi:hypothetical protein